MVHQSTNTDAVYYYFHAFLNVIEAKLLPDDPNRARMIKHIAAARVCEMHIYFTIFVNTHSYTMTHNTFTRLLCWSLNLIEAKLLPDPKCARMIKHIAATSACEYPRMHTISLLLYTCTINYTINMHIHTALVLVPNVIGTKLRSCIYETYTHARARARKKKKKIHTHMHMHA